MTFTWRASPTLLTLPVELICNILHCLDVVDVLHCSQLNKYLRGIISASSSLQYTIELGARKFVSVLPLSKGPPASKRLQLLRDREDAWKSLRWKEMYSLQLPSSGSVYEFVGGYYGNGKDDDRRVTRCLSFYQLPSLDSDTTKMRSWSHRLPDVLIIDFTMDPVQDLLILVALASSESKHIYEVHLRTLSTNEPHPNANTSVFGSVPREMVEQAAVHDFSASIRVQVAGSIVALLIKEVLDRSGAHIEVWDWTAGPHHSASLARNPGIDDFTLLSRDSFLLVRPSGYLEVLTFDDPAVVSSTPKTRAIYQLPPLAKGFVFWYVSLSSNPSAGYNSSSKHGCSCTHLPAGHNTLEDGPSSSPKAPPGGPAAIKSGQSCAHCPVYYPLPEDRIHACCIYVINPNPTADVDQVHSFVFFINIQTFLIHSPTHKLKPESKSVPISCSGSPSEKHTIPVHRASSAPPLYTSPQGPVTILNFFQHTNNPAVTIKLHGPEYPLTIPWEEWGPQNTRWFRERISTDWQHALYGYRTVETIGLTKEEAARELAKRRKRKVRRTDPAESEEQEGEKSDSTTTTLGSKSNASGGTLSDDSDGDDDIAEIISGLDEPEIDFVEEGEEEETPLSPLPPGLRRLRIRDYNPYVARQYAESLEAIFSRQSKGKGKSRAQDRDTTPVHEDHRYHSTSRFEGRLVTEPSRIPAKGVFESDVVSYLPYHEVISRDIFNVTDVMLDESRILLLKRAETGQLEGIDVLMM